MVGSGRKKREVRIPMRLPVRVWGMDLNGKLFDIKAYTIDITPVSARLAGFWESFYRGMNIGIECGGRRARFRVAWVGESNTEHAGEIGVQSVERGRYIWGVPLKRHAYTEDVA